MSEHKKKCTESVPFTLPTLALAKRLLGCELVYEPDDGTMAGVIVETEAYLGPEDRAAHSYGGRRTKRTEVMYGKPGHAYLYRSYGIHVCLNVVSGPEEKPEAILIRALQPTQGEQKMAKNRGFASTDGMTPKKRRSLTNGPGKLVQALGIPFAYYGHDLTEPPLSIRWRPAKAEDEIASGPRIGINNSGEARDYPYRFWLKDNPYVSR
ncbi:MAG TPA: DNA-3-methyladenine glycosylase [Bacillales bacterium]|nr:DNA-3-methyladenine glycosylase [Bacillales bacterium]